MLRTLFILALLGKLHLYKNIFDLNIYKKNKNWFVGYVLVYKKLDGIYRTIYNTMIENKDYGFLSRIFYVLVWYKQRIINKIKRELKKR